MDFGWIFEKSQKKMQHDRLKSAEGIDFARKTAEILDISKKASQKSNKQKGNGYERR